ncbi:hypothetical protein ACHAXT_002863 [Thalassiosira profunda]
MTPHGDSQDEADDAQSTALQNGVNKSMDKFADNPAKRDDWHDLGRFLPSVPRGDHAAAIERNSCMLEDLLAAALEYDARIEAAVEFAARDVHSNSGDAAPEKTPPQDRGPRHIEGGALSPVIRSQIRAYVAQISSRYHRVGFHSFEHASHVMLSATKIVYLLQEQSPLNGVQSKSDEGGRLPVVTGTIHDPWLHFAICLSALLHDVDHKGLPNNELLAEQDPLAVKYGSNRCLKSYAEWNSVEIGLSLLRGSEEYRDFAAAISNPDRFYKTVTDLVLCTDIASQERRELGMQKWERACTGGRWRETRRLSMDTVRTNNTSSSEMSVGMLKLHTPEAARAIAEQIMQAADVSHTMQHFSTFAKWNSHLYHEVLAAYQCGRTPQHQESAAEIRHPKENWYESQIGFFDHYVIPLAERLDACGAFSDEAKFATLAVQNKEQWIEEGMECTRLMVAEAEGMELPRPMPVISLACTTMKSSNKHGSESDSISVLGEIDTSIRTPGGDDMSIPGSVETSSRVSWQSHMSKDALARHANRRKSSLSEYDVDSSVNALVPHVLVQQLVDSLKADVERPPAATPPRGSSNPLRNSLRSSTLRESIASYQSTGSIRRHHGALLFVDISGFTHLSQIFSVEDFKTFINRYFTKIIELVTGFGGEVVKFAGDALYALWATGEGHAAVNGDSPHARNVEKCTACAIAVNATCNNYKVSKSYNRRASDRLSEYDIAADSSHGRGQGEVLYRLQDKNAEYEERDAVLNVYCGVSEGIMAGIDVVANNRAEFFLIGKPLKDVAKAEHLAGPGELVVSPSVHTMLKKERNNAQPWRLIFTPVEGAFQRVSWPDHPSIEDMQLYFREKDPLQNYRRRLDAQSLIEELVTNPLYNPDNADGDSIKSDLMHLLETHRHEAARAVVGKFTAELRRVVVLFISIMYEPNLPADPTEDSAILENFRTIYTIISEAVSSRSGQVRQFINDDKGTVFIAAFGLRGSVVLHPADTAVDAAKDAQRKLLDVMDVQCSIGITLGKIFCGETGSFARYEYSLLGPSVNLSARLMAKGAWGQINCDEELQSNTGRRHKFTISGSHQLKGYSEPVPFYTPADESSGDKCEEQDDIVTFFMQKEQVLELAGSIQEKRSAATTKSQPRVLLIKGDEGKGKDAFVTAILKQPKLADSSVILMANRCYHDDPFYCFIPIITRILLSFSETRERLIGLKKRQKRSSTLATFLANDAIRSQPFPSGTDMVRDQQLVPYLSLANDFVFKGFPLLKSTTEARRLKDGEKVEKCIEVLSALIEHFLELGGKPGMISISEIDRVDSYSKKLLRRILKADANLLIIGGASHAVAREPSSLEDGTASSTDSSFAASILGGELDTDVETIALELLDKNSTFDLFRWSLRRDFSDEDFELIDQPDVRDKIVLLCGGMTHATARLAHTFASHIQTKRQKEGKIDLLECLRPFMNETPTDLDQITIFRIDQLKPQEQMLLKIASVAGFDQYSFTQNLLETVLLALSRKEFKAVAEEGDGAGIDSGEGGDNQVPLSIGGDEGVPNSVGVTEESKYDYIFQGDAFEQTLESLVRNQFLEEVNVEMSDLSSMDSVMYRFRNGREQSVINGLMLNDQKKRTHFEVAVYYSSSFNRGGDSIGENDSSSLSTDMTFAPTSNWELFHIIGLHFDLADASVPALLNYYDSSAALASLGVRDKAHGRLLSAYLMLEKVLHDASILDAKIDENAEKRRQIAGHMVRTIGNEDLKDSMKVLTREHLRLAFAGDIFAFKKALVMLTKFGQSVGTIEKEGYIFGSELYLQAILLVLLVLEDDAFSNLTSSLSSFLGQDDLASATEKRPSIPDDDSSFSSSDSCLEEYFNVDDLTVSFPAFSGLLTFYRDSPIGANQVQETFLANLFVAVTQEANQMIHVIRTKCILSHLYLKHGDISKALEECESIKELYDHDRYSLELVTTYGMDWSLICVMTMASTYLFRGQFAAARHNIDFLKAQMTKLDEFASSTKAMSKGNLASFYLLLHEYEDAAKIANGINATQYGYFFKPIGTLQEELANRELSLNQHKTFDISDRDIDLLSVLSSTDIKHNRSMLNQSAETLSDRGIESVRAALCATEIRNLGLQPNLNANVVRKQINYCQAGLLHLAQSLDQMDANNHERRKNYLLCLHQRAHLLCWHQKLVEQLQERFGDDQVDDTLGIKGTEIELSRKALDECAELSKAHEYPFMLLLTGNSYIKLGLNISEGESLIQSALEAIDPKDHQAARDVLSRANRDERGYGTVPLNQLQPPSPPRGVPSAA